MVLHEPTLLWYFMQKQKIKIRMVYQTDPKFFTLSPTCNNFLKCCVHTHV